MMALVLADALMAHKAQCELFPVGALEGIYPNTYVYAYAYIYICTDVDSIHGSLVSLLLLIYCIYFH
jgi:hypothetical protein